MVLHEILLSEEDGNLQVNMFDLGTVISKEYQELIILKFTKKLSILLYPIGSGLVLAISKQFFYYILEKFG